MAPPAPFLLVKLHSNEFVPAAQDYTGIIIECTFQQWVVIALIVVEDGETCLLLLKVSSGEIHCLYCATQAAPISSVLPTHST